MKCVVATSAYYAILNNLNSLNKNQLFIPNAT